MFAVPVAALVAVIVVAVIVPGQGVGPHLP